jgi:hypothetical protein
VSVSIYTKVNKQLLLAVKKYNQQYSKITVNPLNKSHDRFLIIDEKHLYHIGASLKNLGKKWFAFSKMELDVSEIVKKLGE